MSPCRSAASRQSHASRFQSDRGHLRRDGPDCYSGSRTRQGNGANASRCNADRHLSFHATIEPEPPIGERSPYRSASRMIGHAWLHVDIKTAPRCAGIAPRAGPRAHSGARGGGAPASVWRTLLLGAERAALPIVKRKARAVASRGRVMPSTRAARSSISSLFPCSQARANSSPARASSSATYSLRFELIDRLAPRQLTAFRRDRGDLSRRRSHLCRRSRRNQRCCEATGCPWPKTSTGRVQFADDEVALPMRRGLQWSSTRICPRPGRTSAIGARPVNRNLLRTLLYKSRAIHRNR
jgi:hypothetical protein